MSKKEKKDKEKKVTRREFLKKMGLFAVSGIALSKLDKLVAGILKANGEGQVAPTATTCYTYRECAGSFQCVYPSSPFQCNMTFVCDDYFYCPQDSRFICVNTVNCVNQVVCNFTCSANYNGRPIEALS